jgi:uncharacterized protein (TIGR03083 family)
MSYSLADFRAAHEIALNEIGGLTADLTDDQWQVQSLCPAWTVRECAAHVIGVETVLAGWAPSLETPPPFEIMGPWMEKAGGMSGAEFNTAIGEIMAARLAELAAFDDGVVAAPSITPVGPQTYGGFLRIRIFDLWVHARDIGLPLGIELPDGGLTATMALDEVHRSMGYIMGKKVGLEDGMSATVHVTGGVERDIHVTVDGRAALVDSVDNPTVELTADVETFVMLACGRVDPQERIDAGRISWTGADEWGDKVARNLRFTM